MPNLISKKKRLFKTFNYKKLRKTFSFKHLRIFFKLELKNTPRFDVLRRHYQVEEKTVSDVTIK